MAAIKGLDKIREKYARVTPARTEDYAEGVRAPKKDWAEATGAAAANYTTGVQAAIARKAFESGVKKAGSARWQAKAATIGVDRWGPGILAAVEAYERGFAPYRETIERLVLPPRFSVGDARNYERVKAIGEALRKRKVGGV